MRLARIVTGLTMVAFFGVGMVPGVRQHARAIRLTVLAAYLVTCAAFVIHVSAR